MPFSITPSIEMELNVSSIRSINIFGPFMCMTTILMTKSPFYIYTIMCILKQSGQFVQYFQCNKIFVELKMSTKFVTVEHLKNAPGLGTWLHR